ncbi:MAG TPA: head completion protein [Flavobacteriales bacterium]|nr:head completion protein [Nitrospina sp.]HIN39085.1 head completion protein [Flavobacteriales bacterium]
MSYRGKWKPKNLKKYEGDHTKIVYRSLWERQAFRWCDDNSDIMSWGSETVIVPYVSKIDGKRHRYFVDLKITFNSGKTVLVEIKPKKQTVEPKKSKRKTKKYIKEVYTYGTNLSKWEHAKQFAENRGWVFEIWTEEKLQSLGIKILKMDKYSYGRKKPKKHNTANVL